MNNGYSDWFFFTTALAYSLERLKLGDVSPKEEQRIANKVVYE